MGGRAQNASSESEVGPSRSSGFTTFHTITEDHFLSLNPLVAVNEATGESTTGKTCSR